MNKLIEKIYSNSPNFVKDLMVSIYGYKDLKVFGSNTLDKYLGEYNVSYFYNEDMAKEHQFKLLKDLIGEVKEGSPYYKEILKDIDPNDFNTITQKDLLKKIPFLSKDNLKDNLQEIFNTKRKKDKAGFTSGTSGTPLNYYYDLESRRRSFALWRRFHEQIGLPKEFKSARFSGRIIVKPNKKRPPFWVKNSAKKQLFLSTYHMTSDHMIHYVNKINEFKPELIDGYPSSIYILSKYINQNNLQLDFTPKAICTTAETLYDHQRTEIEKAFSSKVFNQFASSEGMPFITECKKGKLHMMVDSGIFEFYKPNSAEEVVSGLAELVVTSFRNYKTPLIRYRTGDMVLVDNPIYSSCDCGCHMPTVVKIIGREDDILFTEEKGSVGRMDPAFKGLDFIKASQLIQVTKDLLKVLIVKEDGYEQKHEDKLIRNIRDRLGSRIEIQAIYVDSIPIGPNGKFKSVVREFDISE